MAKSKLIAESGATKAEWCLLHKGKKSSVSTQGISPYFFNEQKIADLLQKELLPHFPNSIHIDEVYYYGTGMRNPDNVVMVKRSLQQVFKKAAIDINDDMLAAARALNGNKKGVACNLGTGSFCCYYDGKKIIRQTPGIGYILGDEGSGAYLGKKVIQYYLYKIFDDELCNKFDKKYKTSPVEILENIYRKPLANRYLAAFSLFLSENRGHYMIENIIEDGLNDFFFNHLNKYKEALKFPVHFTGGVAFGFQDVLQDLCGSYQIRLGKVLKNPMPGLIEYHS
ncbi:MAG TPA: N-acetylglucosamine kinase [Chitinophagaceae bacterium]|nr:N-acetylglucosamine kinase [Chitinophagaceae bacterium]